MRPRRDRRRLLPLLFFAAIAAAPIVFAGNPIVASLLAILAPKIELNIPDIKVPDLNIEFPRVRFPIIDQLR